MKKNILINAANLHVGGGVQVAVSFIYELARLPKDEFLAINVIASTSVNRGLVRLGADLSAFVSYRVIDLVGIRAFGSVFNNEIMMYDVVFTVFGPNYLRAQARREIVGFAQPWMLSFRNPVSEGMSFVQRAFLFAKLGFQWMFFLRANHYVVELEHVRSGLCSKKKIDESDISVVHNTVSSMYLDRKKWTSCDIDKENAGINLGFVSRDYPHKNINILAEVARLLKLKYNMQVNFYVTLNEQEWISKDASFKENIHTVGMLSPDQCPSFYAQMDGVVFPSLLECFSATPLEAMVMSKPLFASDRHFVRDVCGGYAIYFDPLNADDIARNIADYFGQVTDDSERLLEARKHALNFSSAEARALRYLQIIKNIDRT